MINTSLKALDMMQSYNIDALICAKYQLQGFKKIGFNKKVI
ncbi:hypothetical protein BHECKSOX2_1365 [Bathymodiolus heckerae thiotrophic gill symbiont]|nr:hypothetical protein [Bathymodiolus heckerae thiotrophic gill symbiont]SMN14093.1 hypothetical protein BHECKSOX2_1365 [Bathymodiolus heckerae thiotrophic gill symbiont]